MDAQVAAEHVVVDLAAASGVDSVDLAPVAATNGEGLLPGGGQQVVFRAARTPAFSMLDHSGVRRLAHAVWD